MNEAEGRIHFVCAAAGHRGGLAAFVTVHQQEWAYCEGGGSSTEHVWGRSDPPRRLADLEIERVLRRRTEPSSTRPADRIDTGPRGRREARRR